jgi:non-heme chloroperoxidase
MLKRELLPFPPRISEIAIWAMIFILGFVRLASAMAASQAAEVWHDPSSHRTLFITVDKDVQLEVLDWGGSGPPLVLLSGLGNSAHVFDDFAPKLTARHHVYGITRRGYGASSAPATGYTAERLGDDVLAVLAVLKLDRPVLVGHSIAGEELSSIGSRFPNRVAGLVYLEASYGFAFYDSVKGYLPIDVKELHEELDQLLHTGNPSRVTQELLNLDLPAFERVLRQQTPVPLPPGPSPTTSDLANFQTLGDWYARVRGVRFPEAELRAVRTFTEDGRPGGQKAPPWIAAAIDAGERKFTKIPAPILAICSVPQDLGPAGPGLTAAERATLDANQAAQVDAFEHGVPSAHVVRLPRANHYVFLSNEKEVLRDIEQFTDGLR